MHHIPTALELFKGDTYSVQYNMVVLVRHTIRCGFRGGGPICINKEVGLCAVICVVTNIPRIQAMCNIRYSFSFESCVNIALLQHSDYIDPPRVLEENVLVPANVISDECLS